MKIKKWIGGFDINESLPPVILATFMMTIAIIIAKLFGFHILFIIPIATMAFLTSLEFSGRNVLKKLRAIFKRK